MPLGHRTPGGCGRRRPARRRRRRASTSTWSRRATGFFCDAPRRVDQLVVQRDDAKRAGCGPSSCSVGALPAARRSTPPDWWRQGRTELSPTTCSGRRSVHRLDRLPLTLELAPRRASSAPGRRRGCRGCRAPPAPAGPSCAGRRLRARAGSRRPRCVRSPLAITSSGATRSIRPASAPLEPRVVPGPEMEVGDVKEACWHRRSRLYSDRDGRRAIDGDLRRPLPRSAGGWRPAQAASRRAADRGRARRRSAAGSASPHGGRASRSAASPSARSGSASPSAA